MWLLYAEKLDAFTDSIDIGSIFEGDYGADVMYKKVNEVRMKYVRLNFGADVVDVYAINFITGQIISSRPFRSV